MENTVKSYKVITTSENGMRRDTGYDGSLEHCQEVCEGFDWAIESDGFVWKLEIVGYNEPSCNERFSIGLINGPVPEELRYYDEDDDVFDFGRDEYDDYVAEEDSVFCE